MKLNYKKSGSGSPIIILHGLFGMLDNWQSIAKALSDDYEVWLVDQRNHGRSPHSDTHNYDAMAADVQDLIASNHIEKPLIVGHSMGGKTALRLAQLHPEAISGIVVVDMGVKEYPIHHDNIIDALKSVPVDKVESRTEAEDHLKKKIDNFGIRQFLLKNLNRKGEGNYEWRFNLSVLEDSMPDIVAALPEEKSVVPAFFIYGSQSDYILKDDIPDLQSLFPNSNFKSLDSGHWVHAEKPKEVIAEIHQFANEL